MKFYHNDQADELKFLDVIAHLHTQMLKMEEHKYLQPKTSKSFQQILTYLSKNTPGAQDILKNNHKITEKYKVDRNSNTRSVGNTMPLKSSKLKTHRDSFNHIH